MVVSVVGSLDDWSHECSRISGRVMRQVTSGSRILATSPLTDGETVHSTRDRNCQLPVKMECFISNTQTVILKGCILLPCRATHKANLD